MSPSDRLSVVIPIRNTDEFTISDKGKGVAEEVPEASPVLSDDESSAERENLK